jgi:hypothetical protein
MKTHKFAILILLIPVFFGCDNHFSKITQEIGKMNSSTSGSTEYDVKQLTFDPYNHFISPFGSFSPDGQWIVYDTRTDETAMGSNANIEKVNTHTGKTVVIYKTPNQNPYGPGCGTPSYSSVENKIVFIHGILNSNADRPYGFSRRTAVMVDESHPGKGILLDARDITSPFTAGALRGGTHAHQWSADGNWIGFTYNDAIMADIEKHTGQKLDLRTVGVSTSLRPVSIDKDPQGENNNGIWFSALVVRVVPDPTPGSDEIARACEDAWVGKNGYPKPDGSFQRARAFQGKLQTKENTELVEVFIVDIPDRIDIPGPTGPLEGTETQMPQPPKGCIQRRLTYTESWKYPGVVAQPRHWLFSSSDGQYIGFLAKDDNGTVQLFVVSPLGGQPIQITFHDKPVQSTFSWHPSEPVVCYACDNSIFTCRIDRTSRPQTPVRVTNKAGSLPIYPTWSPDGKSIVYNLDITDGQKNYRQIFLVLLKNSYDGKIER